MQFDKQQERLRQNGSTMRPGPPALLAKVLAAVIGAALLVVGFVVSLVMLAVVLGAGIAIGGFVWWKRATCANSFASRRCAHKRCTSNRCESALASAWISAM